MQSCLTLSKVLSYKLLNCTEGGALPLVRRLFIIPLINFELTYARILFLYLHRNILSYVLEFSLGFITYENRVSAGPSPPILLSCHEFLGFMVEPKS